MVLGRHSRSGALRRKLRSRRGMTLAELLVSMALMAFLTAGVGMGVSATGPVLRDSLMLSESQLLLDTMIKTISGELRYATNIVLLEPGALPPEAVNEASAAFPEGTPFSYSSRAFGENTALYNAQKSNGRKQVRVAVDQDGFDLIGSGAYSDLDVQLKQLTYDADEGSFAVTIQIIFPDATTQEHAYTVRSVISN